MGTVNAETTWRSPGTYLETKNAGLPNFQGVLTEHLSFTFVCVLLPRD